MRRSKWCVSASALRQVQRRCIQHDGQSLDQRPELADICCGLRENDGTQSLVAGLRFPHFERHNGEGAKKRAEAAERKRLERAAAAEAAAAATADARPVTTMSQKKCDKSVTREEKRRSKVNTSRPQPAGSRQTAMYLAKQLTQKSLPEIGELFGVSITRPCCMRCARSRWTLPRTMADQPGAKIGYIDVEQNLHELSDPQGPSTTSGTTTIRSTCC